MLLMDKSKFDIIQPGDLLHCDFGISYLTSKYGYTRIRLYVLKPGEIAPPDFLVRSNE